MHLIIDKMFIKFGGLAEVLINQSMEFKGDF